jgi:hypothetical protein
LIQVLRSSCPNSWEVLVPSLEKSHVPSLKTSLVPSLQKSLVPRLEKFLSQVFSSSCPMS